MVYSEDQEFNIAAKDSDGHRNVQSVSREHPERTESRVRIATENVYTNQGWSGIRYDYMLAFISKA
jgi:hypothetical protein